MKEITDLQYEVTNRFMISEINQKKKKSSFRSRKSVIDHVKISISWETPETSGY